MHNLSEIENDLNDPQERLKLPLAQPLGELRDLTAAELYNVDIMVSLLLAAVERMRICSKTEQGRSKAEAPTADPSASRLSALKNHRFPDYNDGPLPSCGSDR